MTNREKKEVKEGKEDCPLSTTDWVMFLSNEIDRTERDQPPIMTALIAAILAIMGVGITVAVMRIPESLYYHKLMFLFILTMSHLNKTYIIHTSITKNMCTEES